MELHLDSQVRWNDLASSNLGFMNRLHAAIGRLARLEPNILPQPFTGESLYVASDYGATHGQGSYDWIGLLITDMRGSETWRTRRAQIRNSSLRDGRRMSYKSLGDSTKSRALTRFLRSADHIPGMLVLIYFDRGLDDLFLGKGEPALTDSALKLLASWKPRQREKLLRILHFLAFFVAALSRPGQHVVWLTDEDEIIPNEFRLQSLLDLAMEISGHYVVHNLGYLRFATAAVDDDSRFIEDLLSIPDLAGGGLAATLDEMKRTRQLPRGDLMVPLPHGLRAKALFLAHWFADYSCSLKRMAWRIDASEPTGAFDLAEIRFGPLVSAI
jgi:hypothetical protein